MRILLKMIGNKDHVLCHNEWDLPHIKTPLYENDVFLISNQKEFKGCRIGAKEFAGTHKIIK